MNSYQTVRCLRKRFLFGLLTVTLISSTTSTWARALGPGRSPAKLAIAWERGLPRAWTGISFYAVDSKAHSTPPDAYEYDRRIGSVAHFGFDYTVAERFGLRFHGEAMGEYQRTILPGIGEASSDSALVHYRPAIDFSFVTSKGLELFGGATFHRVPKIIDRAAAGPATSSVTYGPGSFETRRFGVLRRTERWQGGFTYDLGGEGQRSYQKMASDGSSLVGEETLFVAPALGVIGNYLHGGGTFGLHFQFIQALGQGPKDINKSSVYTDHFDLELHYDGAINSIWKAALLLGHRSLSYGNSAYIGVDTMPVSRLQIELKKGSAAQFLTLGCGVVYGKDRQSIPEFNATYELWQVNTELGFYRAIID